MDNALTLGKRAFSAAIAAATILWAVGIAAFAVPQSAFAASAGDRIKGESLPAVYYYGYDGSRYTFPNLKTYETWFLDFSGVQTVSSSELSSLSLAGNIVYRPGSRWIKIQSDPKTYAVSTSGSIHWIESEAVAVDYAGSDWNTNIDDVPDTFFPDYSTGASLMSATAFDGALFKDGGNFYIAWNGEKRMISAAGRTENNMRNSYFLDGANINSSSLASGADITGSVCDLKDAAQTGCEDEVLTGPVTVSASSATPAGATLPKGANSVPVFTFRVAAGSEAATVSGVTATMSGIGATTNISNAYLYKGSMRLTEARSVNASTRQVSFNGLGLSLAAGESADLTVRIELSATATAGDQIKFQIDSASNVSASGTVAGSFPIAGNAFSIAGASAGEIDVTKSGTISNPTLGQNDAVIGKFKITANTEDASVREITLKIDNATDHSDYKLWDGSTLLASGVSIGNKLVSFTLSSASSITKGSNKVYSVSADIGGDAAETIKVYVDNQADIVAIGGSFGFGMTVDINDASGYDGTTCTSSAGKCSFSTVQGGNVTIVEAGPAAGSISTNSQDQVLLNFNITASQAITVKDLDIIVYADDDGNNDPFDSGDDDTSDNDGLINTGSEGNISDIKIIDRNTGEVLMGPLSLDYTAIADETEDVLNTPDVSQTIDFTEDFSMEAGETLELAVVVDVDDTLTTGTELGAAFDISGLSIEDKNGDALTSGIVPSGDIQGKAQKAEAASLSVTLASTPGDVTTVDGTQNVTVQAFSLVTGDASDLDVSSITLSVYADEDGAGAFTLGDVVGADVNDFIASCSLYDLAGALLDGPKAPEAGGATIVFDDISWMLEAGSSELLTVKCNFNNPSDTTDTNYFAFDLVDLSEDITVVDEDNRDVDPTTDAPNGATPTNIVTVLYAGTLAVAADSSAPGADFLLTSTSNNLVGAYRLTAASENFNVTTFTLSEEAAEVDTGSTDSSAYANNVSQVTISYPAADGSTKTKTTTMTGNEARFSSLDMLVKASTPAIVKAYVAVPATARDAGGSATSNEKVLLGFFIDATNDDNFAASGASSGAALDDDNVSAVTTGLSTFVVRETKPTVTISSSSPSGTKIPGDQEVLRFNIAASANEDVVLEELVFDMNSTDLTAVATGWNEADTLTASDFDIYNRDALGTALDVDGDWAFLTAAGVVTTGAVDVEFVTLDLTTPIIISAGSSEEFSLYFDSTGANAAVDDSVQFSIAADPIVSAYLDTTDDIDDAACAANEATCTADDGADSTLDTAGFTVGDIVCFDEDNGGTCAAGEEIALVAGVAGDVVTFVRGYLGRASEAIDDNSSILRLPSTFVWQDDGTTAATTDAQQQYWGSYLVDSLPVTGNPIGF